MSMTSAMCSVARGSRSGADRPSAAKSTFISSVYLRATSSAVRLLLLRLADDLVVDVGDVADEAEVVAARAQVADDDVQRDLLARVADVTEVVDRRAAGVEADLAGHERLERDLLARARVVDPQGHRLRASATRLNDAEGQQHERRSGCCSRGRAAGRPRRASKRPPGMTTGAMVCTAATSAAARRRSGAPGGAYHAARRRPAASSPGVRRDRLARVADLDGAVEVAQLRRAPPAGARRGSAPRTSSGRAAPARLASSVDAPALCRRPAP